MWNDLRFVIRMLRRSPGFTFLAILSLALGIGANTAIFSLLDQAVVRSLPVREPVSLVSLESDNYTFGWTRRDNNHGVFSYPAYRELRDRNQVLSGLIGRASFPATLAAKGEATRAVAEVVTGNFFDVLGVRPAFGRLLSPSDDAPNQEPVIVLSYSYWSNRLGRDPNILNTRVLMNGHPVLVVGIGPAGFRGLLAGQTPDFFATVSAMSLVSPGWLHGDQPDAWWLNAVGRLKPGVSSAQAGANLAALFHSVLESEIPAMSDVSAQARQKLLAKTLQLAPAGQGLNVLRERWQTPLLVLMVMVGLVLLIACANVANLLVARATARQWEIAVRVALGASRWQISRQMFAESLTLALVGGLLGVFFSDTLTQGLLSLLPADESGGWLAAQIDLRVFAFGLLLALLTGLLFGLIPALQAARPDVAPALKQHSRAATAGASQSRARQILAVVQVGLSLLLLTGAGLFTRSLLNLIHTDPGFRAGRLLSFSVDPSLNGYSPERSEALFRNLEARLRALPLAASATRSAYAPFGGWNWGNGAKAPGSPRASQEYVYFAQDAVAPGYFRTLGIPLQAGREFAESDSRNAPKVAIINETLARFLFDTQSPIGRHMILGATDADVQIAGVVKDSKYEDVREKPGRFLYVPFDQADPRFVSQATFFVRTRGEERQVMGQVRAIVRQLDANVPIQGLTSMQSMIDGTIYRDRLIATLAVAFGILAAILAAVGLYGIVSYAVARRTPEFAIRLVMGAAPGSLVSSLLRDIGRLVAIGIVLGLPLSYALARLAEAQFFGVRAHDPWVLILATLFIAAVALSAALVPALRATRIEPIRALRYE